MPRYRIKAPSVNYNGVDKYSGLDFKLGVAETANEDQIKYARAQGFELTRLHDEAPAPSPDDSSNVPDGDPSGDGQPGPKDPPPNSSGPAPSGDNGQSKGKPGQSKK